MSRYSSLYAGVMAGVSVAIAAACGGSSPNPVNGSSGATSTAAAGESSAAGSTQATANGGTGTGSGGHGVGGNAGPGPATANAGSPNAGNSGSGDQGGANSGTVAPMPSYWETDWISGTSVGSLGVDATEHIVVGGVVPTGKYPGLPDDLAILVRRYDSDGNVLWTKQWSSNVSNLYRDLVVDPSGNFYLTYAAGKSNDYKSYRMYLGKYDASGAPIWQQDSTFGGMLALGQNGDLFVAGNDVGTGKPNPPLSLARYDAKGALQWQTTFNQDQVVSLTKPVVDAEGNAYVAISHVKPTAADPNISASENIVYRFDPSGAIVRTLQVAATAYENIYAIAVDPNGNLYTSGVIDDAAPDQSKGYDNALLRKYDASGKLLWSQRFGNTARAVELGPISLDVQGNPYVVGYSEGPLETPTPPGAYVAFIRKYDTEGNAQWTETCALSGDCRLGAIAIAASGNVYAGGAKSHPVKDSGEDNQQGLVVKYAVR